jgi:hypothetical protein
MSITIRQVRNAQSLQENNLRMEVEINHPIYGWLPYGLDPADTDMTIDNDALMALIGTDFAAYVQPTAEQLASIAAAQVRSKRDQLLLEVDAFVGNPLRWADLTAENKSAWSTYRTDLLDVPQQDGFPNVSWPNKPVL